MNSKRLFWIMCGTLTLFAIGAIAGVVYGDRALQSKTSQLNSLKAESRSLQEQQRLLVQAKKDVAKYTPLEKTAKSIVPQEKDQARTVREIVKLAGDSGIRISTISFPTSTLGDAPKAAAAPATPAPEDAKAGSTTTTPTVKKPATPTTTQVVPVEGVSGLSQMELTVQSDATPVPYSSLLQFLARLEQNRRTAQVTSITVQPDAKDRNNITFSLKLIVYIKQ